MSKIFMKLVFALELISLLSCVPIVKDASRSVEKPAPASSISVHAPDKGGAEVQQAARVEQIESNGQIGPAGLVAPSDILATVKKELVISGKAQFRTDLMALPAKFVRMELIQGEKTVQDIQSDADGYFKFRGAFQEGEYFIKVKTDMQRSGFKVSVQNNDLKGLVLLIDKK